MKRTAATLLLGALCMLGATLPSSAQMVFRSGGGDDENDIVFLRELGVIAGVEPGSDDVRVLMLLPDAPPGKLQKGDILLMVDGERVKGLEFLRDRYAAVEVGDTMKIGVRRGDQRFLTSLEKKAEEPGHVRMIVAGGPGAGGDIQPMHEFGVLVGEKEGKLVVTMRLPIDDVAFEEQDEIRSVNGREVANLAELREAYDGVAVGDPVEVVAVRAGEEIRASRTRSEAVLRVKKAVEPQ